MNLAMRQLGPLVGVSHYAAHRVIDTFGQLLALAPVRRRPVDPIVVVDGTLIPTRDHRLATRSNHNDKTVLRRPSWRSATDVAPQRAP